MGDSAPQSQSPFGSRLLQHRTGRFSTPISVAICFKVVTKPHWRCSTPISVAIWLKVVTKSHWAIQHPNLSRHLAQGCYNIALGDSAPQYQSQFVSRLLQNRTGDAAPRSQSPFGSRLLQNRTDRLQKFRENASMNMFFESE